MNVPASLVVDIARRSIAIENCTKQILFSEITSSVSRQINEGRSLDKVLLMNKLKEIYEAHIVEECRWETQAGFATMLTDVALLLTTAVDDRSHIRDMETNISTAKELIEGSMDFPWCLSHFVVLGEESGPSSADNPHLKMFKWAERLRAGIVKTSDKDSSPSKEECERCLCDWLTSGVQLLSTECAPSVSEPLADAIRACEHLRRDVVVAMVNRLNELAQKHKERECSSWELTSVSEVLTGGIESTEKFCSSIEMLAATSAKMQSMFESMESLLSKLVVLSSHDWARAMVIRMHGDLRDCIEHLRIGELMDTLKCKVDRWLDTTPADALGARTMDGLEDVVVSATELRDSLQSASMALKAQLLQDERRLLGHQSNERKEEEEIKWETLLTSPFAQLKTSIDEIAKWVNHFIDGVMKVDASIDSGKQRWDLGWDALISSSIPLIDMNIALSGEDNTLIIDDGDKELRSDSLKNVIDQIVLVGSGQVIDELFIKALQYIAERPLSASKDKATLEKAAHDGSTGIVSDLISSTYSHVKAVRVALEKIRSKCSGIIDQLTANVIHPAKVALTKVNVLKRRATVGNISSTSRSADRVVDEDFVAAIQHTVQSMTDSGTMLENFSSLMTDSRIIVQHLKFSLAHVRKVSCDKIGNISAALTRWSTAPVVKAALSDLQDTTMHELEHLAAQTAAVTSDPTSEGTGIGEHFLVY